MTAYLSFCLLSCASGFSTPFKLECYLLPNPELRFPFSSLIFFFLFIYYFMGTSRMTGWRRWLLLSEPQCWRVILPWKLWKGLEWYHQLLHKKPFDLAFISRTDLSPSGCSQAYYLWNFHNQRAQPQQNTREGKKLFYTLGKVSFFLSSPEALPEFH